MNKKKSNAPLEVLLSINTDNNINIDNSLIKEIYELHFEQQYEKDRFTLEKMRSLVEDYLSENH